MRISPKRMRPFFARPATRLIEYKPRGSIGGGNEFITYENRRNPHVTIHAAACRQIRKRGGHHAYGQGGYVEHESYVAATEYARQTGLPVIHCSYCKPETLSEA